MAGEEELTRVGRKGVEDGLVLWVSKLGDEEGTRTKDKRKRYEREEGRGGW